MGFELMCVRLWFWLGQEMAEHSCGRTQNEGDSGRSVLACPSSCYHCLGTNRAYSTPAVTPHTCGHAEFRCRWPNIRAAESPVPTGSQAKQMWATWPHQSLPTTLLAGYLEIILVQAKWHGGGGGALPNAASLWRGKGELWPQGESGGVKGDGYDLLESLQW